MLVVHFKSIVYTRVSKTLTVPLFSFSVVVAVLFLVPTSSWLNISVLNTHLCICFFALSIYAYNFNSSAALGALFSLFFFFFFFAASLFIRF